MRTRFDEFGKQLVEAAIESGGQVALEYHVVGPALDVDIWFRPHPGRACDLASAGLLGRMASVGPCLIEPYRNTPRLDEFQRCVCKQYIVHHHQARAARRGGTVRPAVPKLWLISSGAPRHLLRAYAFEPMPNWPSGCYQSYPPIDGRHIVVVRELPATRQTLLVRLLGRGPTFRQAVEELGKLPESALEKRLAVPALVAFRLQMPQDLADREMQDFLQTTKALYAEWKERTEREGRIVGEQQGRIVGERKGRIIGEREGRIAGEREGQVALVLRLLAKRFGPLPEEVCQRVKGADLDALDQWAERLLTAASLDQVFAG